MARLDLDLSTIASTVPFDDEPDETLLGAALAYAERGLHVFPCRRADKRPLTKNGFYAATTDPEQIRSWWQRWPDAMIAMRTGPESGVWVLDPDVDAETSTNGLDTLAALEDVHGPLPLTACSLTPRGGRHYLFSWVDGVEIRNGKAGDGIDVRGAGGYVVLPPSRRADGIAYAWDRSLEDVLPAEAPAWLVERILKRRPEPQPKPRAPDPHQGPDRYAEAALDDECAALARQMPPGRGSRLNTAAFNLGQLVAAGLLDGSRVRVRLLDAATACGLLAKDGAKRVAAILESGLNAGLGQPREATRRARQDERQRPGGTEAPQDADETSEADPGPAAALQFDGDEEVAPPAWLVKHLLPREGVAFLGGQSGAAKTFVAVALAVALGTGEPFFGRRVRERVGTVILAAEGAGTIGARILAARQVLGTGELLPIAWTGDVPNLADPKGVEAILPILQAAEVRFRASFGIRLGLVVVDTVAAAFAIEDENDARQAQRAIEAMRRIGASTGALVLPVHHYGKDSATGLRGSSAFRGGADAVLSILADRNEITGEVSNRCLALAKSRWGPEGPVAGFELRHVELGVDEDGEAFGSSVLDVRLGETVTFATTERSKPEPRPIQVLRAAFDEVVGEGREVKVMGDGPAVRAVTLNQIRPVFRQRYVTGEEDEVKAAAAVRQGFKRALEACVRFGFATGNWAEEEWLWRP